MQDILHFGGFFVSQSNKQFLVKILRVLWVFGNEVGVSDDAKSLAFVLPERGKCQIVELVDEYLAIVIFIDLLLNAGASLEN